MSGTATGHTRIVGPFADLNIHRALHVDPRSLLRDQPATDKQ